MTRHWAFTLFEMLQNVTRPHAFIQNPERAPGRSIFDHRAQQDRCGKGTFGREDEPQACVLTAGHNTTITFGSIVNVYSPELEAFLAGNSGPIPDIVVLGAGSNDIWDPAKNSRWREIHSEQTPLLRRLMLRLLASPDPPSLYWRKSVGCMQEMQNRIVFLVP